ncbi:stress responsive A/B barrel domain protein [Aspergillus pseudoustus]|uniref:Stress responsive A/B barrel domain protein n=1 Tax=Aspergillus pseudoustus TaxID=1810923 RepID=A0ABR4L268_9EURO
MAITHIVLFSFKPDISDADKEHALNSLREIKDKALHPTTGKPLATSLTGGKNNSPKNFNKGYEYAFTWEFDSAEDRDYYTFKDPYHSLITPVVLNAVENVIVVDYTPGEW